MERNINMIGNNEREIEMKILKIKFLMRIGKLGNKILKIMMKLKIEESIDFKFSMRRSKMS